MKRYFPIFTLLIVISFTFGALSGCAPMTSETVVEPTASFVETAQPVVEPTGQPVQENLPIIDAFGRTINLVNPQRIVIAGKATPLLVNTFYAFEETLTKVVGIEVRSQSNKAFITMIDPDASNKTTLEKDAGPEQIAPLKPDVVVMKSYMQEKLGNPLEEIAIPVVYLDLETPEQFYRDLETIGAVLGNPQRAAEVTEFYQIRALNVEARTSGLSDEEKPRTLMLQYSESGGEVAFEVPSADYLQTVLVEMAGGNAVWKGDVESGGWNVVNLEQIAAWNPEIIYIVDYDGKAPEIVQNLRADTQWQSLPAIQTGMVFAFPNDFLSWDQPDTRWILGLEWLAKITQPQLFLDLDLNQEIVDFYSSLYNLPAETIDSKVLPLLEGYIFSITD